MSAVLEFPVKRNEIISYNPATNKEIGRVRDFSAEEVRAAIQKSRKASKMWSETSFAARKKLIMQAREVILAEMEEIARLISDEAFRLGAGRAAHQRAQQYDVHVYARGLADCYQRVAPVSGWRLES
jgi:acyl-CoA reductase-like NAD-dependent aldehyde dehydrogenase